MLKSYSKKSRVQGLPLWCGAHSNPRAVSLVYTAHPLGGSMICPLFLSWPPPGKPGPPFPCFMQLGCSKEDKKPNCLSWPWLDFPTSSVPLSFPGPVRTWQGSSPHPPWQGRLPHGVLAVDLGLFWGESQEAGSTRN